MNLYTERLRRVTARYQYFAHENGLRNWGMNSALKTKQAFPGLEICWASSLIGVDYCSFSVLGGSHLTYVLGRYKTLPMCPAGPFMKYDLGFWI
jgi:hypothetical protein